MVIKLQAGQGGGVGGGGGGGVLPAGQASLWPGGNPVFCVSRWNTHGYSYTCQHMDMSPCSRRSRLD